MSAETTWLHFTMKDGDPLYIQLQHIVAIRSHPDGGSVIYPAGFGDTGWIVREDGMQAINLMSNLYNARGP